VAARLYEASMKFFDNSDGFSFRLKHTQAFSGYVWSSY